jgi:hypothetical protein
VKNLNNKDTLMAGFDLKVSGSVSIAANTTRTLAQIIAPSDQKLRVREAVFTSKGAAGGDKSVLVQVVRQTGAGTSSAHTIEKMNDQDTETIRSSALGTFSGTEPTTDKTYWRRYMAGFSGQQIFNPFTSDSNGLIINEGERVAFVATIASDASGAADIGYDIKFEE